MTETNVGGTRYCPVEIVSPALQASTNTETVVTDSGMDARPWRSVAYTSKCLTNAIKYSVYGANAADYSDEVAGAAASYAVSQAPYGYYRVKIKSDVDDTHGSGTVRGIAKG